MRWEDREIPTRWNSSKSFGRTGSATQMFGQRELTSNLARTQGWTNGSRTSPRAPSDIGCPVLSFFKSGAPIHRRLAFRINKAMCDGRIWDSTHSRSFSVSFFCLLSSLLSVGAL
jgi:hypothetical protein